LTGTPTAPTAAVGTNTTQIATTAFVRASGIGYGQTWQDVAASRAVSTNYTNSTGKPILVNVSYAQISTVTNYMYVDGVLVATGKQNNLNGGQLMSAIVPNGSTYSVTSSGVILSWAELR
jgi:hypothetical protein